jgi:flagellar hook-length control protein FliK
VASSGVAWPFALTTDNAGPATNGNAVLPPTAKADPPSVPPLWNFSLSETDLDSSPRNGIAERTAHANANAVFLRSTPEVIAGNTRPSQAPATEDFPVNPLPPQVSDAEVIPVPPQSSLPAASESPAAQAPANPKPAEAPVSGNAPAPQPEPESVTTEITAADAPSAEPGAGPVPIAAQNGKAPEKAAKQSEDKTDPTLAAGIASVAAPNTPPAPQVAPVTLPFAPAPLSQPAMQPVSVPALDLGAPAVAPPTNADTPSIGEDAPKPSAKPTAEEPIALRTADASPKPAPKTAATPEPSANPQPPAESRLAEPKAAVTAPTIPQHEMSAPQSVQTSVPATAAAPAPVLSSPDFVPVTQTAAAPAALLTSNLQSDSDAPVYLTLRNAASLPAIGDGLDALALRIAAKSADGDSNFQIRLDPPELGNIEIRLNVDSAGNTHADVSADKPQTLDLLQRDAPALERALKDAGLSLPAGLSFSLKGDGRSNAWRDPQGNNRSRSLQIASADAIGAATTAMLAASLQAYGAANARLDIRI